MTFTGAKVGLAMEADMVRVKGAGISFEVAAAVDVGPFVGDDRGMLDRDDSPGARLSRDGVVVVVSATDADERDVDGGLLLRTAPGSAAGSTFGTVSSSCSGSLIPSEIPTAPRILLYRPLNPP
jgi:hypothetical protein